MKNIFGSIKLLLFLYLIVNAVVVIIHIKLIIPLLPILVVLFFWKVTRKERFINSLPTTSEIGKVKPGPSKVDGKIYAKENLISPYFKDPCVGYLYVQEDVHTDTEGSDWYSRKLSKTECADFYLTDSTGEILVESEGVNLEFCTSRSQEKDKIRHAEFLVRHQQHVIVSGNIVLVNNAWKFSSNEPVFVASPSETKNFKRKIFQIEKMKWYFMPLYLFINYLVFFYDVPAVEQNSFFLFFSFFGLPIVALFSLFMARVSRYSIFTVIVSTCLVSSFLTFPLIGILYLLALPTLIIQYSFYATVFTVALYSAFNSKSMLNEKS